MNGLVSMGLPAQTNQKIFDNGEVCLGGYEILFLENNQCKIFGKIFSFKKEEIRLKQPKLLFDASSRNSIKSQVVYQSIHAEFREDEEGNIHEVDKNNFIIWLL